MNVSDINKWANSRDPEGTAARGEKGQRHIFAIRWVLIRKDCIFTLYLALLSLLGLKNAACGIRRGGVGLERGQLPLGREGWRLAVELGWKNTRFSAPPSECSWAVMEQSQTVLSWPGGWKAKVCPGKIESQTSERYFSGEKRGLRAILLNQIWQDFSLLADFQSFL